MPYEDFFVSASSRLSLQSNKEFEKYNKRVADMNYR